jgi:hypothetical protein
VHEPERWRNPVTYNRLQDALEFLTGDRWSIEFRARARAAAKPRQGLLELPQTVHAVIPYSNGLDSKAVAGIFSERLGDSLVRVRLGGSGNDDRDGADRPFPFAAIPYKVVPSIRRFRESSARSRGFKFALISGLAAYLAGASEIIIPESGQGALGPSLVAVGQAYVDYRSHPLFTQRMESFLKVLLGVDLKYRFPQLWRTKAETLSEFIQLSPKSRESLAATRSCWQQAGQVGISGTLRQCGICAACMLRRLSMYISGVKEGRKSYVWEDLHAKEFAEGAAAEFSSSRITDKLKDYAIAGTLHLEHLASFQHRSFNLIGLNLNAFQLSGALALPESDVTSKIQRLLSQHESEWRSFLNMLGRHSFVRKWVASAQ